MYTYGWFVLLFGRNRYNIVEQLSSSEKKKLKKKKQVNNKVLLYSIGNYIQYPLMKHNWKRKKIKEHMELYNPDK